MRCTDYRHWLSPYVDGQLEQVRRAELDAHLAGCQGCRVELASLQEMLHALQTMERPEAPALLPGIRAKLSRRPWWETALDRFVAPWPASLPWHGLALATAAVLVVVLVGVPTHLQQGPKPMVMAQLKQKDADGRRENQELAIERDDRGYDAFRKFQPQNAASLEEKSADAVGRVASLDASQLNTPVEEGYFGDKAIQPIRAAWRVADPTAALSQVSEWVSARSGTVLTQDARHLTIRLAASDVPEFLQRFSTPPPARELASSRLDELAVTGGAAPAAPPSLVSISLELLPSE
jgi:hypothetical protein